MTFKLTPTLAAVGIAASAAVIAVPATAAPPDDTFEVAVTPTTIAPGGTLSFSGTCWGEFFGPTTHVNIYGALLAADDEPQFGFEKLDVVVDLTDGSYAGTIEVPGDALEGGYRLSAQCITQDQVLGYGNASFVVEGDPIPTTTVPPTSEPEIPTTQVPTPPITAPPATPKAGSASYTG